jgi:hypothetical protein
MPLADDAELHRRVRPDQVVDDQNLGLRRPSSAAFKDPNLSVDAEPILRASGLDWQFSLSKYPDFSLASITAGFARSLNLSVEVKPEDDNPSHTEVIGKKTQGIANSLRDASKWIHLKPKG